MSLLISILATWRLTHLINNEDGPFSILARFRHWAGVRFNAFYSTPYSNTELGKALICHWCLSVWIGVGLAIIQRKPIWYGLAYSAGAIAIAEKILNEE